jgi:hypothetical protein
MTELPSEYMLAKLAMVMPLFQESRDALPAITEQRRVLYGLSKTLADRMDVAGEFSIDDWSAQQHPAAQEIVNFGELQNALEEIAKLKAEIDQLRGFAQRVMESWPFGDVDGGDLQDAAIKFGLLAPKTPVPTESCGVGCVCAEYASEEEFAAGEVHCLWRTELLTGVKS